MTSPLTPERKQEIRERSEKATPGPWKWDSYNRIWWNSPNHPKESKIIADILDHPQDDEPYTSEQIAERGAWYAESAANAVFIAHARTDLPDLLESHEALVEALAGLLSRIDHVGTEIGLACFHAGIKIPNIATEAEAARAALRNAGVQP